MRKLLQISITAPIIFLILASFSTTAFGQTSSSPDWKIAISGSVENPVTITLADLIQMPQTSVQAELTCYGYPLANGWWKGTKLWSVLETAGITLQDVEITFQATDGYTIQAFPMIEAQRDDVIIAYELDGMALPETVRLVVPRANGNVWIKWITQITVNPSSSQVSPILPQSTPLPSAGNLGTQEPSIAQISIPKPTETVQQNPTNETSIVEQQPIPAQTQPAEKPQPAEQENEEAAAPPDYSHIVVAVSALLVTSAAAGTLIAKKRKKTKARVYSSGLAVALQTGVPSV